MAKHSIINVNKNADTTLEFNIGIDGVDNPKDTQVELCVEGVVGSHNITIKAEHKQDDVWMVTIPKLDLYTKESYDVHLTVVVDGYYFVPAKGTMKIVNGPAVKLNEGINSGSDGGVPGQGASVGTDKLEPEFPVEYKINDKDNQPSNNRPPLGDNSVDHIDTAFLDTVAKDGDPKAKTPKRGTPISDIASSVNGVEGPQLAMDDTSNVFDAKAIAQKILRGTVPHVKEAAAGSKRLLTPNDIQNIIKDPAVEKAKKERSHKISKLLGV